MIRILLILMVFVALVSCHIMSNKQILKATINSDTTLILKKKDSQKGIWRIDIKFVGNFNDTDTTIIHLKEGDDAYKYKLIGNVDTLLYNSDWYSDSCWIKFENVKKPVKDLQIEYKFLD